MVNAFVSGVTAVRIAAQRSALTSAVDMGLVQCLVASVAAAFKGKTAPSTNLCQ